MMATDKETQDLRGFLKIEIDENAMKARLAFKPDREGGQLWDREKIILLLEEEKLKARVTEDKLNQALSVFTKTDGAEVSVVIVEGVPAEDTVHESIEWIDLKIPDELSEAAERCFKEAPAPELYSIREEKVKSEEVVQKKSSLLFLKPKQEKVTRWKKREILERVDLKPIIEAKGYVEKGEVIATLSEVRKGKAGSDVFGNPIAVEAPKDAEIYLGNGVRQRGFEIVAEVSGFLRRGRIWADIIPYKAHQYSVHPTPEGTSCLLDFIPGNDILPSPEVILRQAMDLGIPEENLITKDGLTALMRKVVDSGKDLRAEPIIRSQDAVCTVNISPDRIKATLTLKKSRGRGRPLSLKEIGAKIKEAHLRGIDTERVKADILKFHKGPEVSLADYILVEGKYPTAGKEGSLELLIDFLPAEEIQSARERVYGDQEGRIASEDSYPIDLVEELAFVKKDQKLVKITPPTVGSPGQDVFGSSVPGIIGRNPDLDLFENVNMANNLITASCEGLLEIGKRDNTLLIRIRPYSEGQITVRISEDRMKAFISIKPAEGDNVRITAEQISEEMGKQGILKGINSKLVMELSRKVEAGFSVPETVIAEGLPPRRGSGSRLHFHVYISSGKTLYGRQKVIGKEKNDGKAHTVKRNDLIAEILPPTIKSKDGWDITGEQIIAQAGPPIDIDTGKNVRREELENGMVRLIANEGGEVFYDGNFLDVMDTRIIESNVTPAKGNINFSGSIQIKGSVESRARVFSGGDIRVDDSVGGAVLSSDGSIFIKNGVRGAGRAILRSKGSVMASFIEEAMVLAVGDVKIKNSCLRCTMRCNSKLFLESEKGNLIGGSVKVKQGISLMNLGSEKQTRTEVHFGQDYLVSDQIELEEREIEKLKKQIMARDVLMQSLEKKSGETNLQKVRKEKLHLMKLLEKRSIRLFNLKERFEEHFPSEIEVKGEMFPGVIFESHGRFLEVNSRKKGLVIFFDSETGRIRERTDAE